jgi:hypothetical protein
MHLQYETPRFSANFEIKIKDNKQEHTHSFVFEAEPPREIMDAFQALITPNAGPHAGAARISVSTSIDIKDFGTGAGGMVVISLACDQEQTKIHQAIGLASQAANYYAKTHRQEVEKELLGLLEEKKAKGIKYGN